MALPMMPKATAVWLVENSTLTFKQIAAFCGLHDLEVQAIADGEVAIGMTGLDPVAHSQLSQEELDRCVADPKATLQLAESDIPLPVARTKGARYTPVSKRQDKPDAIAWLVRFFPELADAQIGKLLGTTKPTIKAVRERSHWNTPNIRPRNPVELGMCGQIELDLAVDKAKKRVARAEARTQKASGKAGKTVEGGAAQVGVPVPPLPASGPMPPAAMATHLPPEEPRPKPQTVSSVFGESASPPSQPAPVPSVQDVFATPPAAPESAKSATRPADAARAPKATGERVTGTLALPIPGGAKPKAAKPAAEESSPAEPEDEASSGTLASLMPKALRPNTPEAGPESGPATGEAEAEEKPGDGETPASQ